MTNLGTKTGVYLARFRFQAKEYKRSLKTSDADHAHAAMRRVDDALHWIGSGHLAVPEIRRWQTEGHRLSYRAVADEYQALIHQARKLVGSWNRARAAARV